MPEAHQRPPTKDALHWHLKRANYTSFIMKSALIQNPDIPSPDGHGWTLDKDNVLKVHWMSLPAALGPVLNLISCS